MKTLSLLAVGLALCGAVQPARAYDEIRSGVRSEDTRHTPATFRRWADGRIHDLKSDLKKTGKEVDRYDERSREKFEGKLDDLKERTSKAEGRLKEVGTRDDKTAWQDRDSIRDELKSVRKDLGSLRRDMSKR